MKKILTIIAVLTFMLFAVAAFARPWGMMAAGGSVTPEQQKFFDETKELRKQMHDKRFELMELNRNPKADNIKVAELENEINTLRAKVQDKAKDLNYAAGCGNCGNKSLNCPNNGSWNCSGPCGNCDGPQAYSGCGKMQGRMLRR